MSFSALYHFLIQKQQVRYRQLLTQRISNHLQSLSVKAQQSWMHQFLQALASHCPESEIFYYVSMRSVDHFLKSLETIVCYHDVDDLCLDICYRHVCRLCTCRDGETTCLQPHI